MRTDQRVAIKVLIFVTLGHQQTKDLHYPAVNADTGSRTPKTSQTQKHAKIHRGLIASLAIEKRLSPKILPRYGIVCWSTPNSAVGRQNTIQ